MSEFLGRQDCIESLRRDLVDLQGATLDVFSRTGPVRCPSWKFPDKLSCNLDMVALLDQYDYTDGDEAFSQHSHIILLELVIDRLLLLLQSFNAFVELLRCGTRREQPDGCQSVGLVVRNYWRDLVEFVKCQNSMGTLRYNPEQTKTKETSDSKQTLSPVSHQISQRSDLCRRCLSAGSSPSSFNTSLSVHVNCPTAEASSHPCDTCCEVQSILRRTGQAFVDLLQSEGLPSSLQPLLVSVEDTLGQMTAADIAQWANEQLRDMRRLGKHLQDVRSTVQPLTDKLDAAQTQRDKFRSQLDRVQKEFKQETEKHQANIVQLDFSLRKTQRSLKETEQRLQEEREQLKRETLRLKDDNSGLREKVTEQQNTIQAQDREKTALQEEVRTLQVDREVCRELQRRVHQLESQIQETQLQLHKENAKYYSACRQQESMQAKQTSLLKRVDTLDEECEELQRQLGEREESQISLNDRLRQMSEEKEQVEARLTQQQELCLQLRKEKKSVETRVSELQRSVAEMEEYVQVLKERERLLVAFPELSPLARSQPQSTGNVLLDMKQQLKANDIRVKILEQENTTLQTSLMKLTERVQTNGVREASPEQVRSLSNYSTPEQKLQNHQTLMLQSSGAARLGCSNRWREESRGESGLDSAGSGDQVSTTAAVSPSSLQLHLQTLHLHTDTNTAAKSCTKKTRGGFILSHSRSSNQRK